MNPQQTYWLEELKQSDKKLERLDSIAMELVKFYFLTLFSISTVVFTLYNYQLINTNAWWFFFVVLVPFIFGLAVINTLNKIVTQYVVIETNRNQISEWFAYGQIKNDFKTTGTLLSSFYTLLNWLVSINFIICLYFAFPFMRNSPKGIFPVVITILITIAFIGILSSVVLVSLNTARKKGRDAVRRANIANLRVPLELYYGDNNHYPITNDFNELQKMLSKYISVPIEDPLSSKGFVYEYTSEDGKNYLLSYTLEDGGKQSIDSNGTIK